MKERINYHEHDVQEETFPVASANECTGLMFTPPENSQELESYQQLSPMAIPRKSWGWQTASAPPMRKGPGLAPGLFPFGAGEKPVAKMGILWYTSSHKRAVSRESAWKRSC